VYNVHLNGSIFLYSFFASLSQVDPNAASMLTRHARRIYAGGIPPRATEIEIANFFNDVMTRAMAPARTDGPPVIKIYLNVEKCYAFVEFSTIELTTAAMQLDGIKFDHPTGATIVRVRRPNDYRPEMLPPNLGPVPQLNLSAFGITAGGSSQTGPGKVFIGGLPYNLTDEQIMELLGAFGPIKSFHQVRDPGSITSKGYGFCEYVDPANAETAIAGLNGMALGEKTLSVRLATQGASGGGGAAASAQQAQQQYGMGGMGSMGGIYGGGVPVPQVPAVGGGPPSKVSVLWYLHFRFCACSRTRISCEDTNYSSSHHSLCILCFTTTTTLTSAGAAPEQHGDPRGPGQRGRVRGHQVGREHGVPAVRQGALRRHPPRARRLPRGQRVPYLRGVRDCGRRGGRRQGAQRTQVRREHRRGVVCKCLSYCCCALVVVGSFRISASIFSGSSFCSPRLFNSQFSERDFATQHLS